MILPADVHTHEYVFGAKRFAESGENQDSVMSLTLLAAELAQIDVVISPEEGNYLDRVKSRVLWTV